MKTARSLNYLLPLLMWSSLLHSEETDYTELDLQALMQVSTNEIVSVAKKGQQHFFAPAAATILTHDDIIRSGVATIPDALRLVPGLHVARANGNSWEVASRGLGGLALNKLLVLMDGRSLYDTILSGVYWDLHLFPLDDVDRIEIVRGPGASLWGLNAMNGVINIVTKNSKDTSGNFVSAAGGIQEQFLGHVRSGFTLGSHESASIYVAANRRESLDLDSGGSANDANTTYRAGARFDSNGDQDVGTLQTGLTVVDAGGEGTFFDQSAKKLFDAADKDTALNTFLLGRWSHKYDNDSDYEVQFYFDHTERNNSSDVIARNSFYDIDFIRRLRLGRHALMLGGGGRHHFEEGKSNPTARFSDSSEDVLLANFFVQDEIRFSDFISLTLGSKLSYHDYIGLKPQPGARLSVKASEDTFFWGAVNRALRTPSRFERGIRLLGNDRDPNGFEAIAIQSDPSVQAEDLISYELGFRHRSPKQWHLDVSAFFSEYDSLLGLDPKIANIGFGEEGLLTLPLMITNIGGASVYGAEVEFDVDLAERTSLKLTYSLTRHEPKTKAGLILYSVETPQNMAAAQFAHTFADALDFNAALRFVDTVRSFGPSAGSYIELDSRLAYQLNPQMQLSFQGLNLLQSAKREFVPITVRATSVKRVLYAKLTYSF
jgi:iron complex outermembrane receptor protein